MAPSPLFAKLNLKDQREIFVLNAPVSCGTELERLQGIEVRRQLSGASRVTFALAFVTQQSEVDRFTKALAKAAEGDAVIWFAYPKGTSMRYKCEISRDTGWNALGKAGFEGVRMVAIDEDWSAARFRRVEFIKTMKRDSAYAMSKAGKARTAKAKKQLLNTSRDAGRCASRAARPVRDAPRGERSELLILPPGAEVLGARRLQGRCNLVAANSEYSGRA